jgi:hypothetical protein
MGEEGALGLTCAPSFILFFGFAVANSNREGTRFPFLEAIFSEACFGFTLAHLCQAIIWAQTVVTKPHGDIGLLVTSRICLGRSRRNGSRRYIK